MSTQTSDEIRAAVARSYGNRVRPVLEQATKPGIVEMLPIASAGGCCGVEGEASCGCGTSSAEDACCGTAASGDDAAIVKIAGLYAQEEVADLPSTVTDVSFGCGNPTAISALQPGETVLDLGSGGGIDCFLAAKMVGPEGRVFGVDMTREMIDLARANSAKVGATNVEFRLGEIEHLPIEANTVDVIISNCVINLSPDKPQVFREAFRVLKPGGRLQVSDVVWTKPVPQAIKDDLEQWAGCVAGALLEREYLEHITAAGFTDVTSVASEYPGGKGIASANVVAFKR
ncbi:MAG: arsenite methyltransferase [Dehalococcoidia bacterium]